MENQIEILKEKWSVYNNYCKSGRDGSVDLSKILKDIYEVIGKINKGKIGFYKGE